MSSPVIGLPVAPAEPAATAVVVDKGYKGVVKGGKVKALKDEASVSYLQRAVKVVTDVQYSKTFIYAKKAPGQILGRIGSAIEQSLYVVPRTLAAAGNLGRAASNSVLFVVQKGFQFVAKVLFDMNNDFGASETASRVRNEASNTASYVASAVGSPFAALYNKSAGVRAYQVKVGALSVATCAVSPVHSERKARAAAKPVEADISYAASLFVVDDSASKSAEDIASEKTTSKAKLAARTADDAVVETRKLVKDADAEIASAEAAIAGRSSIMGVAHFFGAGSVGLAPNRKAQDAALKTAKVKKVIANDKLARALKNFDATGVALSAARKAVGSVAFRAEASATATATATATPTARA